MKEYSFDYEQTVRIGVDAHNLLNSEAFTLAVGQCREDLMRRFYDAQPHESEKLKELRREGNALSQILKNLGGMVNRANAAVQQQQNADKQI